MTADEFLRATAARLPSADELVDQVRVMGWRLTLRDGGPRLSYPAADAELAAALVKLLRREPWRSAAVAEAGGAVPQAPPPKPTLDRKKFREALEKFWEETGWTPLGGWKPGECNRREG